MDIKIGELFANKTWRFLAPSLKGHGEYFLEQFNAVFKLAVGIHDTLLGGSELSNGRYIYVLIDKKYKPKKFREFMGYLECQNFFKGDYCPDVDLIGTRKHMIILEIPSEFHDAYDKFLQSRYSEMYSKSQIENLFSSQTRSLDADILTKRGSAFSRFQKEVFKEFGEKISFEDFHNSEWELPLKKKEEIFNFEKGRVFFNERLDKVWLTENKN